MAASITDDPKVFDAKLAVTRKQIKAAGGRGGRYDAAAEFQCRIAEVGGDRRVMLKVVVSLPQKVRHTLARKIGPQLALPMAASLKR